MKVLKNIFKDFLYILLIPLLYIMIALIFSVISVNNHQDNSLADKTIYLATNGVHLDIVMPKELIDANLLLGIKNEDSEDYLAFGWGDENFYINTPTWADLTFSNACNAIFLNSPTLVHVTRFQEKRGRWVAVKITDQQLNSLNDYLQKTFITNNSGFKIILENKGYSASDDFYRAKGNYTLINTCNSWVNEGFKTGGLKACYWTPFDFGLLKKYVSN